MSIDLYCGKEEMSLKNMFKVIKYRRDFKKANPEYFVPDGLVVFIGPQGSGKTLSAVNYTQKILKCYPKCKLVTNLYLREFPTVTFEQYVNENVIVKSLVDDWTQKGVSLDIQKQELFKMYRKENRVFPFFNNDDLQVYRNGQYGVIFLIDEIQLYLNSLASKNVNMDVMTTISQQRKQRIHIVSTSQCFGRIAKPLREQFSNVMLCKNYFNMFQKNMLIDRDSLESDSSSDTNLTGEVKKTFWWVHSPDMYKRYDTYTVVKSGQFKEGNEVSLDGLSTNY